MKKEFGSENNSQVAIRNSQLTANSELRIANCYPSLLSAPELIPGMRIVVKEENTGWNGHSGIIMSKRQDDFWVLLDHTIAQGMEVKHLLKPHQIELETQQSITKSISQELFTATQVEQKVADAIAQYNCEKAESEQGRFIEIRDAALQTAKQEIQAAQEHAIALAQKNQDLIQQLATKEDEVRWRQPLPPGVSLQALQTKNQQLEQRVAELEKALENSSANNWGNTFNNQAAKVVNSELEKTIEPLMSEVDRLNNVLSQKEQEIFRLQMSSGQESDAILAEFGGR